MINKSNKTNYTKWYYFSAIFWPQAIFKQLILFCQKAVGNVVCYNINCLKMACDRNITGKNNNFLMICLFKIIEEKVMLLCTSLFTIMFIAQVLTSQMNYE